MTNTIAVVDDDAVTRETLKAYFEDEGFSVLLAGNAAEFTALRAEHRIDIALLDIRLPDKDGLTVTRELRPVSDIGIVLITGRSDNLDRIIGLELGADDYIKKPFEPREVLARVRNLLRRIEDKRPDHDDRRKRFGQWTLYLDRRRLVRADGTDVHLTTAEFDILAILVCNPGKILARDYILEVTARRKADSQDRTIDTLVRRLRRILEDDPKTPKLIVTVHGGGYMFAEDVT
ncbi:response regulator [Telmatospirillum sp.]|uniref:response regulator n=1 Tax=Telmatospirillum sp. TaxID=2079197 RepID=UPI0028511340|nr:response regulator [Telmatospirillum sp.]MDR3440082.1 response regulator [Telmatospirillum sp.]